MNSHTVKNFFWYKLFDSHINSAFSYKTVELISQLGNYPYLTYEEKIKPLINKYQAVKENKNFKLPLIDLSNEL